MRPSAITAGDTSETSGFLGTRTVQPFETLYERRLLWGHTANPMSEFRARSRDGPKAFMSPSTRQ